MVASAAELLRGLVAEHLTPRVRMAVDEWADRHVRLVEKTSAEPGQWRTDRTPYLRRPLRLFSLAGRPHQITMMTGSQVGKTALIDLCKLWSVDQRPGPTLQMFGDIDSARGYNQDRFLPTVRECREVSRHLLPSPQETKDLKINFDSMIMYFVGSNSKSGRRHKSIKYLYADEVETYEDPTWVEVFEREKAFGDSKRILTSTPWDENAGIHRQWLGGTRERYWVPCPECGLFQVLVFAGLKWEKPAAGSGGDEKALAKATARYECAACKGSIHDYHKPAMLRRGIWIAEKVAEGRGRTLKEPEAQELSADRKDPPEHASFQLSSLYSPFGGSTLGHMALEFVKAGYQATPEFVRGWIGEPWKAQGDRVEEDELRVLSRNSEYYLGFAPQGVMGLVLTVDVQKDLLYLTWRGWGAHGRDTWLVQKTTVPRKEGHNLVELDGVARSMPRVGGVGDSRVIALGIDSGHFTGEVYEACRRLKAAGFVGGRVFAMKGHSGGHFGRPWSMTHVDVYPEGSGPKFAGKGIPGGVDLVVFNTDVWKTAVVGRIKGRPELDGSGADGASEEAGTAAGEVPGFYLPRERRPGELDDYIAQVTSEHRAVKVDTRGRINRRKGLEYVWELRPGRTDNHYLDCETENFALADFLGVRRAGAVGAGGAAAPTSTASREHSSGTGRSSREWAAGAGTRGGNWKDV